MTATSFGSFFRDPLLAIENPQHERQRRNTLGAMYLVFPRSAVATRGRHLPSPYYTDRFGVGQSETIAKNRQSQIRESEGLRHVGCHARRSPRPCVDQR